MLQVCGSDPVVRCSMAHFVGTGWQQVVQLHVVQHLVFDGVVVMALFSVVHVGLLGALWLFLVELVRVDVPLVGGALVNVVVLEAVGSYFGSWHVVVG